MLDVYKRQVYIDVGDVYPGANQVAFHCHIRTFDSLQVFIEEKTGLFVRILSLRDVYKRQTKMCCFYIIKLGGESAKTFLFILFVPQILVSLHQKIIYDFIRVYK